MNLKIFSGLALVAIVSHVASAGIYDPPQREPADPSHVPYIVAIEGEASHNYFANGLSGVLLREDIILTVGHGHLGRRFRVQAPRLRMRFNPSQTVPAATDWDGEIQLLERGGLQDYRLVRAIWYPNRRRTDIPVAAIHRGTPSVGDIVDLFGYPLNMDGILMRSWGQILAVDFRPPPPQEPLGMPRFPVIIGASDLRPAPSHPETFIIHNASQSSGNSGGPLLLRSTGELVGIASRSASGESLRRDHSSSNKHSWAVPIQKILEESALLRSLLH